MQEAERCAMKAVARIEDIAYGRRMIELVENERDQQGAVVRARIEAK